MVDSKGDAGVKAGVYTNTRRYIRFKPDTSTYAEIDTRLKDEPFTPEIVGLVYEESSHGCGMVLIGVDKLQVGDICRIQIGTGIPIEAEVRWRKEIDPDVVRTGFLFLEAVEEAG